MRCGGDGGLRILARRIEERQYAEELPRAIGSRARNSERTKTSRGELLHCFVNAAADLMGVRSQR
jgi:hypothetical protein